MKEVKDLSLADLMEEGRRWAIAPGEYVEGEGFRVDVIVEDHPFRFSIGQITNIASDIARKIPHLAAADDSHEAELAAQSRAEQWCLQHHGLDKTSYFDIVSSSIKAYEEGKLVRVFGENPDCLVLANGFGDEIKLDEEAAIKLYEKLADALDLPCQRHCRECGGIMEDDKCEVCGAQRTA